QIMVENIRRVIAQDLQCVIHTATEVGYQSFDFDIRVFHPNLTDTVSKVLGTTITEIITVNRGDNHIAQLHVGNGLRKLYRLFGIRRQRTAVGHVAERTTTSTDSTQNHEGRSTVTETLCQVRARGFLTHRVEVVLAHRRFDLLNTLSVGRKL